MMRLSVSSCQQPEVTPVIPFKNKIQYYKLKQSFLIIPTFICCDRAQIRFFATFYINSLTLSTIFDIRIDGPLCRFTLPVSRDI
jgi:hypothetical protein